MLALPKCQMVAVFGPVASGKTFLLKTWIMAENRVVVFDGTGEMVGLAGAEEIFASPKQLYDRIKRNPYFYRIAYEPGLDRAEDFGHVLRAMWFIDQPKLLICDEFHEIAPVTGVDQNVEMLLRFARHDKLGFVGASQRIADVSKLFTSACRMTVLFRTQEARDLDAIDDRWGCAAMVEDLHPLLHDDSTGVTAQIPQAVVLMRGQAPKVYDFATQTFTGAAPEPEPEVTPDTQPKPETQPCAATAPATGIVEEDEYA